MEKFGNVFDVREMVRFSELTDYQKIKPEEMNIEEAKGYWDKIFDRGEYIIENADVKADLNEVIQEYLDDLRNKSECPETIPENPFKDSDLERRTPEENMEMREEFVNKKAELKKEWEELNGKEWPKYDRDAYSSNGKLVRKEGSDYDAHHIQPLGMGGKNEASNITPLNAEVHYDKQGVHSPDSPYSKLDKKIGGTE